MTQTHLLSVEIKTIEPSLNNLDAHSTLLVFCDRHNNCFIGSGIDEIKTAILGAIPHLGSNFCHPLLFNVQILPGDNIDAIMASINHQKSRISGQRIRRTGK